MNYTRLPKLPKIESQGRVIEHGRPVKRGFGRIDGKLESVTFTEDYRLWIEVEKGINEVYVNGEKITLQNN